MPLVIRPLDVAVVIAYLAIIAAVGLYQANKVRTSGDYFAGGRRFNKFLMMMHALGTGTHADDPVSVTGAAYQHGLAGIWYTYIYLFATPFFWIMAPFFRRSRFITTADFFRARYSGGLGLLYSVMGILTFIVTISAMLKGTGTIAAGVSGGRISEQWAIFAMTAVFVLYGLAGGLVATVAAEAVQGILIVVMSLLLIPFGLAAVGGFAGLHRTLDPAMFSLTAPRELTALWIFSAALMALIGIVAQPSAMEVFSTGKTEFEGRVGYTYGNMVKRFCAMGWVFTGLIVVALVAQGSVPRDALDLHREKAFGTAMAALLPPGAMGLMLAAIFAAQMSSLSAFMVAASALASHNLYKGLMRPFAADSQVLAVGRISGFLVVGLGVGLAGAIPSVADALTLFWAITTLTGVLIWAGVLWRRANTAGAWASFVVMVALWAAFGPAGKALAAHLPGAPGWLGAFGVKDALPGLLVRYLPAGILTLVAVSLLTKPQPADALDKFFLLLATPVGQEGRLIEAGVPVVYAGETRPHPWETRCPRLVHWGGFAITALVCAGVLGVLRLLAHIGS